MAHVWNPGQYLKFAGHRLRPALDLLARIDVDAPGRVFDLGCGAGNVTRLLADRWPDAAVTGVDGSREMLENARGEHPDLAWEEADLAGWAPDAPADVLFSNAALHWLDGHETLFPNLLGFLAPGGALAVQMPNNYAEPSHTCMDEAIEAGPWGAKVRDVRRIRPVHEPADYYAMLAPESRSLDIWETVYTHVLDGDNAVAEWTKGSALKPILDALDEAEREAFFRVYSDLVGRAYPQGADGRTLFSMRRLFIVAGR